MKTFTKVHSPIQLFLLYALLLFSADVFANIESENLYNSGLSHYEDKNYARAIIKLEDAIKLEPEVAKYHHILAVSYGREAEQVNWITAMNFARKTLTHLEIAIKLDADNLEILDDLMDYYREAPGFLGGNDKKADEIEHLIEKLSHNVQLNSH